LKEEKRNRHKQKSCPHFEGTVAPPEAGVNSHHTHQQTFGVIPTGLFSREIAHTSLTGLREVGTMHERKQLMYDLADGFVALPGGLGTLEELAEVTTWSQLGLHAKPVVLLDVDCFWDPLVAQLDRMVTVGLLKSTNRALIQRAGTAEAALAALAAAHPTREQKWITPGER